MDPSAGTTSSTLALPPQPLLPSCDPCLDSAPSAFISRSSLVPALACVRTGKSYCLHISNSTPRWPLRSTSRPSTSCHPRRLLLSIAVHQTHNTTRQRPLGTGGADASREQDRGIPSTADSACRIPARAARRPRSPVAELGEYVPGTPLVLHLSVLDVQGPSSRLPGRPHSLQAPSPRRDPLISRAQVSHTDYDNHLRKPTVCTYIMTPHSRH